MKQQYQGLTGIFCTGAGVLFPGAVAGRLSQKPLKMSVDLRNIRKLLSHESGKPTKAHTRIARKPGPDKKPV